MCLVSFCPRYTPNCEDLEPWLFSLSLHPHLLSWYMIHKQCLVSVPWISASLIWVYVSQVWVCGRVFFQMTVGFTCGRSASLMCGLLFLEIWKVLWEEYPSSLCFPFLQRMPRVALHLSHALLCLMLFCVPYCTITIPHDIRWIQIFRSGDLLEVEKSLGHPGIQAFLIGPLVIDPIYIGWETNISGGWF